MERASTSDIASYTTSDTKAFIINDAKNMVYTRGLFAAAFSTLLPQLVDSFPRSFHFLSVPLHTSVCLSCLSVCTFFSYLSPCIHLSVCLVCLSVSTFFSYLSLCLHLSACLS